MNNFFFGGGTGGNGGSSQSGSGGEGGSGQGAFLYQHRYSSPELNTLPANTPSTPRIGCPPTPADIYTSEMVLQGRGYPLYCPAPPNYHPNIKCGTEIGDVGCITSEGNFNYVFNVFSSTNAGQPEGFEKFTLPESDHSNPSPMQVESDIPPDTYFSSSVQRQHEDCHVLFTDYTFQCSNSMGAILVLPGGSHREYLRNSALQLRQYAIQNAKSWYRYILQNAGQDIDNSTLFLVTGHEKTTSWGMAVYSEHMPTQRFTVKFRKDTYDWVDGLPNQVHRAKWKAHDPRDTPTYRPLNQTIFLRGWTITLSGDAWREVTSTAVKATSHNWLSSIGSKFLTSVRRSLRQDSDAQDVSFRCYPARRMICNPSVLINDYIALEHSRLQHSWTPEIPEVILSHTEDWCTILNQEPTVLAADLHNHIGTHFAVVGEDDKSDDGDNFKELDLLAQSVPYHHIEVTAKDHPAEPVRLKARSVAARASTSSH
ncbi:hypothetical protein R3P38DRAFT_3560784 [Favolaschia claudopus]|uniref:Uncharacterized protein n=1 Tax=Favolaschia claudopus TaxID=2862362 RepID=A0AAW0AVX7_9AGAR